MRKDAHTAVNQLRAINMVARTFIMDSPFRPKTEEELLERIDKSLEHTGTEDCFDVDEICDELIQELGL